MKAIVKRFFSFSVLNPGFWIAGALLLVALWGVAHVCGWRVDTAVISGTVDPARGDGNWTIARGVIYALTYFAAVVVSPILVLTAGIYLGILALARPRRTGDLG